MIRIRLLISCVALTIVSLTLSDVVQAAVITPTSATATSSISTARNLTETINGDGLVGGGGILTQTHNNTGGSSEYWLGYIDSDNNAGNGVQAQVLDFTLASATTVGAVHIWSYDRDHTSWDNRALASFDIAFSTDGGSNYSTPISITGLIGGDAAYPGADPITSQTQQFVEQAGVTNIQLTNLVNHGDATWNALAEIRFDTVGVPEPHSLMILALGGMGMLVRRRRQYRR